MEKNIDIKQINDYKFYLSNHYGKSIATALLATWQFVLDLILELTAYTETTSNDNGCYHLKQLRMEISMIEGSRCYAIAGLQCRSQCVRDVAQD